MRKDIIITHEFGSAPARVFAALDDHANMGRWLGSKVSIARAVPDGGVGTIRRISAGPTKFDEEIIEREVPSRIVYRIVSGMPILSHHRGEICVEPRAGERSAVRWHVEIETYPGVAQLLASVLSRALGKALARLDRQLATSPAA